MTGSPPDARGGGAAAPWWPVTSAKFVVMTLGTLGIYHLYWIYLNWRHLQATRGVTVNPVLRTLFAPVTCYRLFALVREDASAHGVRAPWSAIGIAVAYFITNIVVVVGIPSWLWGLALLLPVLPVQITMAKVNAKAAPGAPRNGTLTIANMAMLIGGALATAWLYAADQQVNDLFKEWVP